jgi:hypothetical protein
MVGVILEISISEVPVIVKGEPRGAIIAFLVATLWEFVHIEWMTHYHYESHKNQGAEEDRQVATNVEDKGRLIDALRPRPLVHSATDATMRGSVWLLLPVSVGLFLAGSLMEVARFSSFLKGETEGCVRGYNLYTLGTAIVKDQSLHLNSATPGVWTLYIAYILFVVVLPLFVHSLHVLGLGLNVHTRELCRIADICSTFVSVEVLLLGIFVVQVSEMCACNKLLFVMPSSLPFLVW